MPSSLRTSFLGNAYYKMLQNRLLPYLQKASLTPNQMTLLGMSTAALVPVGFFIHPGVGLALMVVSGLADSLDGLMARNQGQTSAFGAFLDSSLDRLSDFFYLAGFWVLFWPHPKQLLAGAFLASALLITLMISYVKARAEALGATCQAGMMERGARVVFLMVWALLLTLLPKGRNVILWSGLLIYCGLTLTTLIQRIFHVREQMSANPPL